MKKTKGTFIIMAVMMLSLAACGKGPEEKLKETEALTSVSAAGEETSEEAGEASSEEASEETSEEASKETSEAVVKEASKETSEAAVKEASEGIGEGIGTSTMPTEDEIKLMLSYNTGNWSDLSQDEKWTAVQTMLRMWEYVDGYKEHDIDQVLSDLDFQMNTYIKNKVDIGFFETACDIYGIDKDNYLK